MSDSHWTSYLCPGCHLKWTGDLLPNEVLFCPLCGFQRPLQAGGEMGAECQSCGAWLWKDECYQCRTCSAPLCDGCHSISGRCQQCEEKDPLRDMPASATVQ